jgi:hypothetical protein
MARKRIRLKTVGHVLSEMGRQYRRADNGEMLWIDAANAVRILREMRAAMEGSLLVQRIEQLESQLAATATPAANGRDRNGELRL